MLSGETFLQAKNSTGYSLGLKPRSLQIAWPLLQAHKTVAPPRHPFVDEASQTVGIVLMNVLEHNFILKL